MRRGRQRPVVTFAVTTALLLSSVGVAAGSAPDAAPTFRVPTPDAGGRWLLELEDGSLSNYGGSQTINVRLQTVDGYLPDGTVASKPSLTYVFDEAETQWQHHFLSSSGAFGRAGPVRWNAIVSDAVWEWTGVTFTANEVGADYPSWHYLGPLLWGTELAVGQTITRQVDYAGSGITDLGITLVALGADGCATYEHHLLEAHVATVEHCNDPLPRRVEVHDATLTWLDGRPIDITGDTMHVTPLATGGDLVDPPSWQPHGADAFTAHPPDGSDLPLTLEDAHAALTGHPVAGVWLDDHPDAVAVEGRYGARACEVAEDAPCPNAVGVLGQGLDELLGDEVMELEREPQGWRLRFVAPQGEWMQASVARPARGDPAPALVTVIETGSGSPPVALPAEAVPLGTALEIWREVTQGQYRIERIVWDLTAADPVWVIATEPEQTEPGAGRLTVVAHVSMEGGLLRGGAFPLGIYGP